jgi:Fe-S cluster biogenesis protein NfuA
MVKLKQYLAGPASAEAKKRESSMELKERIEEVIERLNPRLEKLAEGYVQLISVDEKTGTATLRTFGGRLH